MNCKSKSHPDGWLFSFRPFTPKKRRVNRHQRRESVKSIVTKEDIMQAIKECAEELGRTPTLMDLEKMRGISRDVLYARFGNYRATLEVCGIERSGGGFQIEMKQLFLDWAGVVRKLGRLPTIHEFQVHGRYSHRPLVTRYRVWGRVPAGMQHYAREAGLAAEWADVMEIVGKRQSAMDPALRPARGKSGLREGQPVFGVPLGLAPMTYAPTCENGVLFLFGALAAKLGFAVEHIQNKFPDCLAMREVAPGRCQRVRIEFEYESRNFLAHGHALDGCEIIVCWVNNWPDCPLEVIELKKVMEEMRGMVG
jgi:Homing endonuclease associated repeat